MHRQELLYREGRLDNFLFGLDSTALKILLGALLFLAVILATYSWNLMMQKRHKSQLAAFLSRFHGTSCALEDTDIPFDESMSKPLLLLAKAFESSGEYHKSISIYLYLIEQGNDRELLELLGKIYFKAGLLDRAESIFLQILSREPRDIPVLYQLGAVYEQMQAYDKAIATLEPLEILDQDIALLQAFWHFEKLQHDETLSPDQKRLALLHVYEEQPQLYRLVLAALFHLDSRTGWEHLHKERLGETLDLLWYLPTSQLDFDIIRSDSRLTKIYFVRGEIEQIDASLLTEESGIPSIDILAAARYAGEYRGEIAFSYMCDRCKQSYPIAFKRCPGCLAINSAQLEERIGTHEETDYTLF